LTFAVATVCERGAMKANEPLEESYVRTLHGRMFDQVCKWEGTYRMNELNIGCDSAEIVQRIP